MLSTTHLSLRRGTKLLFEDCNFQIFPAQKVGLTGANGCGKSSLFALILHQLQSDVGECHYPENWQVAHVSQELADSEQPAIEFVLDGDQHLRQLEQAIDLAEKNNDGVLLANLHGQLENAGGYTALARAGKLLSGLGFSNTDAARPLNQFSGGWQMRLNLAQALMCPSDLLLLDEPTNHLDLDTIIWLESWLTQYKGTLLLISHDRDFLDNICTHIAHLAHQKIQLYTGNYSAFEQLRAQQMANQQAAYSKQQRHIEHIQSYITRFRAQATKAKQAQSRLKALQRMEMIAPAHVDSAFQFSLFEPEKTPNTLLNMENIEVSYGETCILKNLNLSILAGDRVGLLGANGAGKSTLIKILANQLRPNHGDFQLAKETRIGYFAQHQLSQLEAEHSPLEHLLQLNKKLKFNHSESYLRSYLGGFGFSNDMALSNTKFFSGGEKSRLVLAMIVYQKPNLLLLDEPTNHLDLEMRMALTQALLDFNGAMVIVSHDRYLLDASCDKLLLVHQQSISEFGLGLNQYPKWLSEQNKRERKESEHDDNIISSNNNTTATLSSKERKRLQAKQREQTQPLRNKIKKLEKTLQLVTEKLEHLNQQLLKTDLYQAENKQILKELLQQKNQFDEELETTELAWLDANEQLEQQMVLH